MLYISGLIIFYCLHMVPFNYKLRAVFSNTLGEKLYKLLFSFIILCSILMVIWGWHDFSNLYFYEPPLIMKQIHLLIMFPVTFLWVVAETPNNVKRFVRHPMLMGTKLWAFGHLLANGDLRSMILFLSIMFFSILAVVLSNRRKYFKPAKSMSLSYDLVVLLISILGYFILAYFHGDLFGMPVLPYFTL